MNSKVITIAGISQRTSLLNAFFALVLGAGAAQAQTPADSATSGATVLASTIPSAAVPPATASASAAPGAATATSTSAETPAAVASATTVPVAPANIPTVDDADAPGLTLEQSILVALKQHGDIGAAEQSYISAREGITSAKSGLYPDVSATLDYNYQNNNSSRTTTSSGGTVITTSRTTSITSTGVNISQNIFDGGQTRAQVRQAQARALGAVGGVGSARSNLAYEVAQRFYEQLRQEKLTSQRQGQVNLAQQQLEQIQAQVEAGTAARSDVQSVQVNLSQAKLDLSTAQNNYRVATTNLRNSLGLGRGPVLKLRESEEVQSLAPKPTTPANLAAAGQAAAENGGVAPEAEAPAAVTPLPTDTSATPAQPEQRPLPITVATPMPLPVVPELAPLNTYIAEARNLRPDLIQALANVKSSEQSVALAKIQSRPQITANASYNIDPRSTSDRGFNFGAGVSIPIFDAGGRKADVRASQASLEADKIRLTQLQKDVEADVEASFVDIAGQVDTIANARALVESARVNLDTAIEKYRAGIGIVLDIVNAQTQLFNAETSATQAVYDYELAKSNLDRAVGRFAWADPGQPTPPAAPATLAAQPAPKN